nr:glycosyltransferase [Neoroseomonas eburnea]
MDLGRGFVLAVGRIEPRKNQLRLISALAGGLPLVLLGHEADADYAAACRATAGAEVIFAGRLPPGSALLASAYAACRIFAHVATAEGAPLVALEAGAAGAPLMLSDHPAHREFLGPFARLVPALDVGAMRATLHDLWDHPPPAGQRRLQAIHVATAHGYLEHAATLARLYSTVMR